MTNDPTQHKGRQRDDGGMEVGLEGRGSRPMMEG